MIDPRGEYNSRLAARSAALARQRRRGIRIGNARLAVFACAGAIAWMFFRGALSGAWLALPAALFLILVILHESVNRSERKLARAVEVYARGLDRLDGKWIGAGVQGSEYRDESHPYAEDLDLFGKGSLFELLCTARTRWGQQTLAGWLKSPATAAEILQRQPAVDELRLRLDLRESLAVAGGAVRSGIESDFLSWAQAPPVLVAGLNRWVGFVLAGFAAFALLRWFWGGAVGLLYLALALELAFAYFYRRRVRHVLESADASARDLELLSLVLSHFERERFECARLQSLQSMLPAEGLPASKQIARLHRLVELADSRKNMMFAPVAGVLLWGTQLAFAIEEWRRRSGPIVARWLAATGELEALSALAGYAYENPSDVFPEVLPEGGPVFEARGIAHPLIPEQRCVRNDVSLNADVRLLVVSGSNMSGKSTLLRTVGANAILALAGATVRARSLRLSPLAIGASIRIQDSLQAGSSRFYAEITRLRQIVDLTAGAIPVLFLLDELLHGTNSHDRRIGGEAVVKGLVRQGAIGLLTTHDLSLAHIAEALAPRARNVHFEDHIEGGRVAFDYRLRDGIVQKSNALELMRAVGLEV
jgi:hypothetical protein